MLTLEQNKILRSIKKRRCLRIPSNICYFDAPRITYICFLTFSQFIIRFKDGWNIFLEKIRLEDNRKFLHVLGVSSTRLARFRINLDETNDTASVPGDLQLEWTFLGSYRLRCIHDLSSRSTRKLEWHGRMSVWSVKSLRLQWRVSSFSPCKLQKATRRVM